jgi:hypothetical protein
MDNSVFDPLIAKQFGRLAFLCLAPWIIVSGMNRNSRLGASRFDDDNERLWLRIGLVGLGIILLYFIFKVVRAKGWL